MNENYSYDVLSDEDFVLSCSFNHHFIYGMNSIHYDLGYKYIESDDKWNQIYYQRGRGFCLFLKDKYDGKTFGPWTKGFFNQSALTDLMEASRQGYIF